MEKYELDIYIPSKKIAFEFNGVYWHSEKMGKDRNYHLRKLEACNKVGIKLVQIFEDEYMDKKGIVFSKIRHLLGCDGDLDKVYGRKCEVREIENNVANGFLEKNHIQGGAKASVYFGAYYNGEMIGVMSFLKENENGMWNLVRFATDNEMVCCGVGGKMFKYFTRKYKDEIREIKTFADRRWTLGDNDNLYTKLGFKLEKVMSPEYRYVMKGDYRRIHKFNFRKKLLHKKYGLPLAMTERQMANEIGAYKVYDCGMFKYVWKNIGD